ncbi:MAG: hypothetical protein KF869_10470 [Phycisphaeraceae bacterium]|nr:hypothetical protein [Phycisphaeraceae bacterium]
MDASVVVDVRSMVPFAAEVWIAIGLVAAATVLAILGTTAQARREELRRHDLKVRVHELRAAYQRRLAEIRRGAAESAIPVAEAESEPPLQQAA